MSMRNIRVSAEQEGTRSQVLRWLKSPGETVIENEPLVEIETDKVTVEVAAPASGVLREILKAQGDELLPGEILGRIETGAGANPGSSPGRSKSTAQPVAERRPAASAPPPAPSAGNATQLSPAVRRLLAERGLDAAEVCGSGQGGRITVEDVLNHVARPVTEAGRLIAHSPIRKRIAEHMVQSLLRTSPHVTSVFEADMGAVIAHRAKHRAALESRGASLTYTAYFVMAAVAAIRAVPEANSRWTETALELFDRIDIGIATALETGGLIVPVLRNIESRDLFDVAGALHTLVVRARAGDLKPDEVHGGTFTISNHGVSGSLLATPVVIHQPQAAILGIGKLEKRAVVDEGDQIVVRPRCYVTLTIDHRVMDGLQANRFLQAFVKQLETGFA